MDRHTFELLRILFYEASQIYSVARTLQNYDDSIHLWCSSVREHNRELLSPLASPKETRALGDQRLKHVRILAL